MSKHDFDLAKLNLQVTPGAGSDWIPTPHGRFFAGVLHEHSDLYRGKDVLELGAGLALHTIILARGGAQSITATEYDAELLDSTRRNVEAHGAGEHVAYLEADWLNLEGQFDLIVTNPPFCMSGKTNRRYFIDELILNGHKRLRPGGGLLFVQSSMADLKKTERRLVENGYTVSVIDQTEGPFRDYYYTTPGFLDEARAVPEGFRQIDSQHWETLYAVHAVLD